MTAGSNENAVAIAAVQELRQWMAGKPSGSHWTRKKVSAFLKDLDKGTLKVASVEHDQLTGMPMPKEWKPVVKKERHSFLWKDGKKACPIVALWGMSFSQDGLSNVQVGFYVHYNAVQGVSLAVSLKKLLDGDMSSVVELWQRHGCQGWFDLNQSAVKACEYILDSVLLHLAEELDY